MMTAEQANALATEKNNSIIRKELRNIFFRIQKEAEAGRFNLWITHKSVDYEIACNHSSFLEDLGYEVIFDSCLQDGAFCNISWD